ncbi:M3 family peptidase [Jiangella aurantiaca]|uniref:Dipeptidyl carboxypeptidase n=1 Tax=Jiangella aurantiaca TaxID=2530373 RepID=A0A4R5AKV8_9ACTN|nr:M3 family metallopeptidase [Jiangella aurantiaca]TDD70702.1 M3 family peptidase [Jiangella aurantiaca]
MHIPGAEAQNPFFAISELPYRLPPFERIETAHYRPAFERGMSEQLAEVEAIATNPEPPTFENTVVALERSGQLLQRVAAVFFNQASSDADEEIQAIQAEVSPKLAAHSDAIHLDDRLFARIEAVLPSADELDPESRRLLERYHLDFVRAGAGLTAEQQARLREINEELSALETKFQNDLLADTNASAVVVDDAAQLAGLSADAVTAAAEAARERGLEGKYVITLVLPSGQPVLTSLTDRTLRERIHRASVSRGANGNEHDTRATAVRLATLRAERAALFGHPDHATYVLEDRTAKTPAAVHDMLGKLTPAAVANAHAEAAKLQEAIGDEFELRAWDWAHYSDKVRRQTYDIDAAQLRPYFELDRVLRDGVFYAAGKLYGLSFTERPDLVAYHPDARVFEVFDEDGSGLGLFIGDFFTRDSKRGGAWMNSFVDQSKLLGTKPVVVNNLNIVKPPAGEPALLTFDEVNTMFHEFGHALHGLFSDVTYPTFSGTSVLRDFVEFPSQVNEMWAVWPEVLANYAVHHETGEPLPQELVQRLLDSQIWGEGFATTEYLAATLLDLAWHEIAPGTVVDDPLAFEAEALSQAGVALESVPPRYRTSYFAHIFAGGYSAGYYSYIWSEVLDADTVEWFKENGGLVRPNGDHFRRELLSRGGSVDAMEAFRTFRGRDPQIEPLLVRRGLTQ